MGLSAPGDRDQATNSQATRAAAVAAQGASRRPGATTAGAGGRRDPTTIAAIPPASTAMTDGQVNGASDPTARRYRAQPGWGTDCWPTPS